MQREGSIILQTDKSYLDPDLRHRNSQDFLQLNLTSMKTVREDANLSTGKIIKITEALFLC